MKLYRRKAAIGSSVYGNWSQVSNSNATRRLEKISLTGHYQYRVRACNYSCSGYSGTISTTVRPPKKPGNPIPTFDYVADGNSNIKADTRRPTPSWSNNPLDTVSAASVPTGQDNVGAVGGAHEVGQDGSANYSIRIPAPTGRGGLTPELSLAYNSNGGNTELGIGWDIGGTRLIHRCSSNYALHGEVRGIRFDNEDRLCLDGQPLVAVSGSYGKNGAKYRTVAESYSEIKSLHSEGSLDSTDSSSTANAFRVRAKDGRILYFGGTPDSRLSRTQESSVCNRWETLRIYGYSYQVCASRSTTTKRETYQWMLNRIEDRFGNKIYFTYENNDNTGEQRLKTVTYNDNLHKIKFFWQSRSDVSQAYFAGSVLKQQKLLQKVVTYSSTTALRSLHLSYSNRGVSRLSKISQITECSGASQSNCLQPTRFSWSQGVKTYNWDYTNISGYTYREGKPPLVFDLNGDGFDDIFTPWDGTWKVAYGGTHGFSNWSLFKTSVSGVKGEHLYPINYDSDPAIEIVAAHNGKWWVFDYDPNNPAP